MLGNVVAHPRGRVDLRSRSLAASADRRVAGSDLAPAALRLLRIPVSAVHERPGDADVMDPSAGLAATPLASDPRDRVCVGTVAGKHGARRTAPRNSWCRVPLPATRIARTRVAL